MQIIAYSCSCKNLTKKFYRLGKDAPAYVLCDRCGLQMKKLLSPPSSTSKVTVDNGFQARAVEVNPDIVQINKERSEKNYRKD